MNRFKRLDLGNSTPEELWTEVHNIVQETVNKTIPKEKKKREGKVVIWEGLQITEERREATSEEERERYTQLNAKNQRTAWRDKKAFFNEQCIKLEENNRWGKTRDLFRKTGDIKGTFFPKMGTIKDINERDLVDAEEIKKRYKEYTEEL